MKKRGFRALLKGLTRNAHYYEERLSPSYRRGNYLKWSKKEINIVDSHIVVAAKKGLFVNLDKIKAKIPYRSNSSIRSKIRERCPFLGAKFGTYTNNRKEKYDK